jgi:hypothetical protein
MCSRLPEKERPDRAVRHFKPAMLTDEQFVQSLTLYRRSTCRQWFGPGQITGALQMLSDQALSA